jgi:hypothetical protein
VRRWVAAHGIASRWPREALPASLGRSAGLAVLNVRRPGLGGSRSWPSAPRRWRVAPLPPSGGSGCRLLRIRFRARASSLFLLVPYVCTPRNRLRPGHAVASGSGVEGAQPAERREVTK